MKYQIRCFHGYDELPKKYSQLLEIATKKGFFYRREWLEFLLHQIEHRHQKLHLYAVENPETGTPLMLIPLSYTRQDRAVFKAHTMASVSHMENYAPACFIVIPSAENKRFELMTALFKWFYNSNDEHKTTDKVDIIRLCPFVNHSEAGNKTLQALKDAGFAVQIYANSYNQYEDCSGLSYAQYFEKRSSNQRYNSRRRLRNLEKEGALEFSLITSDNDTQAYQAALDDYILVSVHSWKPVNSTVSAPMLEIIAMAAAQGSLRLGILRLDGQAIAAQFWIFSGGTASMMRPNYHGRYKKLAPGVVLTNYIIEYLLDEDHADALDLGYGNDEYKGKWADTTRGYSGIIAFNPGTVRGFYFGVKHILGQRIKRFLKKGTATLSSRGME
jgi:hypothetical protein